MGTILMEGSGGISEVGAGSLAPPFLEGRVGSYKATSTRSDRCFLSQQDGDWGSGVTASSVTGTPRCWGKRKHRADVPAVLSAPWFLVTFPEPKGNQ